MKSSKKLTNETDPSEVRVEFEQNARNALASLLSRSIAKREDGPGPFLPERIKDHTGKHKEAMKLARAEAKKRKLTLEEYFKIPRQERPF